ncbi:MAG: TonB-dependent receptor [Bacteroidota bacterium]
MQQRISWINCLLMGVFLTTATVGLQAQQLPHLSMQFEKFSLVQALEDIGQQVGCVFSYDAELLAPHRVNLDANNQPLDAALTQLLDGTGLSFSTDDYPFVLILPTEDATVSAPTPVPIRSICGEVRDAKTLEGLAYASVFILGSQEGTTTDDEGNFHFRAAVRLTDTLEVRYLGYQSHQTTLEALQNRPCLPVKLEYDELEMPTVTVQDRALTILRADRNGGGYRIIPRKIGAVPGWGDADLLRFLQLMPGVSAMDESAAAISVRGGTPDQNLILWDGIPIYHTGHFFGMLSAFNPHIVDEVSIYRGGFGAKYGGRVSSVIDIQSEPSRVDSFEMGIGFDLISTNAHLKFPMFRKKAGLMLALRSSISDDLRSETYKRLFQQIAANGKIADQQELQQEREEEFTTFPIFSFTDFNVKLIFHQNEHSNGSISIYNSSDRFNYEVASGEGRDFFLSNDQLEFGNSGLSVRLEQRWNPNIKSDFLFVNSNYRSQFETFYSLDTAVTYQERAALTNTVDLRDIRIDNHFFIDQNHKLTLGLQSSATNVGLTYITDRALAGRLDTLDENFEGWVNTLYADYDYRLDDLLSLDVGLRYNMFQTWGIELWEPRISVDVQPWRNDFHLKLALGQYHQFASQIVESNELGLGEQLWIYSNVNEFPVVRAVQASIGASWKRNGWTYDLELYNKQTEGLTTLRLRFDENAGERPFSYGEARSAGIDLLVKKKWQRYDTWLSYSLSNVQYQFDAINENRWFPAIHDQLHQFSWVHIFRTDKWDLSAGIHLGSGRPYTPGVGVEEIVDEDNGQIYYQVRYDERNSARLPIYQRTDLTGAFKFGNAQKGRSGKVGLSIFNVFDRVNIRNRDFIVRLIDSPNQPNPSTELIRLDRHLLRVTPNIFFHYKW